MIGLKLGMLTWGEEKVANLTGETLCQIERAVSTSREGLRAD